jgi:S-adenosylmethionine:tRNA ribosyltransferase-isomerase
VFSLSDFDYTLPSKCIAQHPLPDRDKSRLMALERISGAVSHYRFDDLLTLLRTGDVLVVNDTRVVPIRLLGRKSTGGKVEALILNYADGIGDRDRCRYTFECLVKASKTVKPGVKLQFGDELTAEVACVENGKATLTFNTTRDFERHLDRIGHVPLPPYINREAPIRADRRSYQTVYAAHKGAAAAPTAGLHFTKRLLARLNERGITVVPLTLHVGYGTFMPVREQDIRRHRIHSETFSIPPETARTINETKSGSKGRIVAVGTTCVRTLEFAARGDGHLQAGAGNCDLFIYPGYRFRLIDAMITNFHLPKSSLIMLVAAFAGRKAVLSAYEQAVHNGYRFYSYGDAMLIR